MTGPGHHVFTGTLDKYTGGQCVSCAYVAPGPPVGNDGTITITFTSSTTANVDLPGNRHIQIERYFTPSHAGIRLQLQQRIGRAVSW
jgi:hypothetical protein